MGQHAFDVDASNFQQIVIEGSRSVPVVVDFWAEWCGPCKVLKPLLEKLAEEYAGKFILAKIDSDKNQALAAQFAVRGIPSVKAIYNGEIIDEFSGALPEGEVRKFLDRILPSPAEALRTEAAALRAASDLEGAMAALGQASQLDPQNEQVRIDAAEVLIDQGQVDEARQLLQSLSPTTLMDDRPRQLLAKVSFTGSGASAEEETRLREAVATNPADLESWLALANLLVGSGRPAEGMDALLEIVSRDKDWNEQAGRKTLLAVFDMLAGDPLVSQYRRKLASALN